MMLTVLAGCGDTSTDTNDNTVDNTTDSTGDTADTDDTGDTTEKPVSKIAILLPGYITDQSWNQGAYEGLKELESQGYEIAYTEDVQAANMESTFRTYCEDGYDFVIGLACSTATPGRACGRGLSQCVLLHHRQSSRG